MKALIIDEVYEGISRELGKYMTVDTKMLPTQEELANLIGAYDVLIMRVDPAINKEILDAAKNLKVIGVCSVGLNHIDLDAAKAKGIQVFNAPGLNANAVAELVVGMLIYTIRNHYDGTSGTELKGKKLGLMAFGAVAQNVARIAHGLGMDVSSFSPLDNPQMISNAGVHVVDSREDLFLNNDIVSLHIPSTPTTKRSIGYDLVKSMKQNAILVNTARKDVIDEERLLHAMAERMDNHEEAVKQLGNRYFFTPKKMGAQTAEANINAGLAAAKQIVEFLRDGVNTYQVNK